MWLERKAKGVRRDWSERAQKEKDSERLACQESQKARRTEI